MKTLNEIQRTLQAHKETLFRNYPLQSLAIFGSYSREAAHEDSDVDILVDFNSPIGIRFIDLAEELEAILKVKVDLVSKNGVKKKYLEALEQDLIYV